MGRSRICLQNTHWVTLFPESNEAHKLWACNFITLETIWISSTQFLTMTQQYSLEYKRKWQKLPFQNDVYTKPDLSSTYKYILCFSCIALGYGLDDCGFESRQRLGIYFTTASRPALEPIQPPIQWVRGDLSLGIKQPGREADHSLLI
jgi:hypothetical protein